MKKTQISVVATGNIFNAITVAENWLKVFDVKCHELIIKPMENHKFNWLISINYSKPNTSSNRVTSLAKNQGERS